jgi:signal transduction histidine kinase
MKQRFPEMMNTAKVRMRAAKPNSRGSSPAIILALRESDHRAEWERPWDGAGWKVEISSPQKIQAECIRQAALAKLPAIISEKVQALPLLQMAKWKNALREILDMALQLAPSLQSGAIILWEPDLHNFQRIAVRGRRGDRPPESAHDLDSVLLHYVLHKKKAVDLPGRNTPPAGKGKRLAHRRILFVPVEAQSQIALLRFEYVEKHPMEETDCAAVRITVWRLQAYLENADLHSRLMSSELRYRSILSTAPFLIALLDAKGLVREINPQLVRELKRQGASPKNAIGTDVMANHALPEELRELLGTSLRLGVGFSREEINLTLPRGPEVLRLHVVPLKNGYSTGELLVIAEIITHYHQLMDEAERTERLAAIGRVAASLAHEVNNPLQALRSHLELIRSYPLSDEEREQSFGILEREVERLDETTRRVLGFARPAPDILQPASIEGMLEQTLALSRNYLQHQQIKIQTDLEQGMPPVQAAPGQLIQVFLNIVLNAAHAMQGCGTLTVRARTVGASAEVVFANDGPPIPSDHLPHIFEPFYTTHPEGTGLGLSISHAILQRHNGTIRAENLPRRKGVAFTITLPFAKEGTQIE